MFQEMGFDEFTRELERLGNLDQIAPELLESAAPILENALKEQVRKEADRGFATGSLEASIKSNKPGRNQQGHYVSVTAKGKDGKGVRNNDKLAYLEFGSSKQQARPVVSKAVREAEGECVEAMQKKFGEATK